jgi:hypothetical protein
MAITSASLAAGSLLSKTGATAEKFFQLKGHNADCRYNSEAEVPGRLDIKLLDKSPFYL